MLQGNICKLDANAAHQILSDAVCNVCKSGISQSHANSTHCRVCVCICVWMLPNRDASQQSLRCRQIVYILQYMHTNINKLILTSFAAVPEPCGPMSLTCVPMHCITGSTLAKVA